MAGNYKSSGEVIKYTNAGAALVSGQAFLVGAVGTGRIGIALAAIGTGASGSVQMQGIFEVTKATTDVVAVGAPLYWDDTAKNFTVTNTSDTLAGYAVTAAGNGVTKVEINLNA